MSMGPITAIFPVPRVVDCAGRRVKVGELRLKDLARLQSALDQLSVDPLTAVQAVLPGLPPRERKDALFAALDRADTGALVYGEESGHAYFQTLEGMALFLLIVLGRFRSNGMTAEIAAEMASRCAAGEYSHVWRIAHGVNAKHALARMCMPFLPSGGQGGGTIREWGELIDQLSLDRGWSYDQVMRLTVTQWVRARNGGVLPQPGQLQSTQQGAEVMSLQLRWVAGEIDEFGRELGPPESAGAAPASAPDASPSP